MRRYQCPACGGNQYSESEREADKPCIYCNHSGTQLMPDLFEEGEGGGDHDREVRNVQEGLADQLLTAYPGKRIRLPSL